MTRGLAELWIWFADTACRGYSPIYDRICRAVATREDVLDMVRAAPLEAHLPNVLLAAVHYLLLGGFVHPLADVYAGDSDADPGPLFLDICLAQQAAIEDLLRTRRTNTNEVGRSALLGPALTDMAYRLGEPLALVDVGCSAGLNLLCDRYRLDYGRRGATGPAHAPVRITCQVVGGEPPIASLLPPIVERVGIDRDPIDVHDDDAVRWQLACVWPDTGRLERSRLAFEEARKTPPRIVPGDAVDTVGDVIDSLPIEIVPIVLTTWALAYLPRERRHAFADGLAAIGHCRPLAWISAEGAGVVDAFADVQAPVDEDGTDASVLASIVFSEGRADAELLAFVQPHGAWLDWRHVGRRKVDARR